MTPGSSCWEVRAGGGSIAEWLAGAVAPTGSVLATDLDLRRMSATAVPAFKRLLQGRGSDLAYARRLPDLLRARGLRGVAGEGRIVFGFGGL